MRCSVDGGVATSLDPYRSQLMAVTCSHLDQIMDVTPSSTGCVGCCDQSPGRHATAHFRRLAHPLIRSYEPGEDWYWCYVDGIAFELAGAPPAPSHP